MTYRLYISFVFAFLSLPAFSDDFIVDGLGYTILDSELFDHDYPVVEVSNTTIDKSLLQLPSIEVPSTVTWDKTEYTVIGIGYEAFRGVGTGRFTLPYTLEYIDDYAFKETYFKDWGNFVPGFSIGTIIPKGVYLIGRGVFENSDHFYSLNFLNENWPPAVDYIPDRMFYDSYNAVVSRFVDIPEGIKRIGDRAFFHTAIGHYELIMDSLHDTYREDLKLPNSLVEIGPYAFGECNFLMNARMSANVKTIGDGAFYHCDRLVNVMLNEGLETIGSNAFMQCHTLNDIPALPFSLKSIGAAAFRDCYSFCRVHIPESSMTVLSDSLFYGCDNLESITIPANIRRINSQAFGNCYALRTVKVMGDLEFIDIDAFTIRSAFNCYSLRDFYCHSSSVPKIHPAAFCAGWSLQKQNEDDMQVIYNGRAYYIPLTFEFDVYDFDGNYEYSKEYPYDIYVRNATRHVPKALVSKYRTTFPWSMFGSIVAIEDEEADGIFHTVADRLSPRDAIYDMNGRRLNEMHRGINIINGRKILVRP